MIVPASVVGVFETRFGGYACPHSPDSRCEKRGEMGRAAQGQKSGGKEGRGLNRAELEFRMYHMENGASGEGAC
jgi:hypothetical protein